MPRRRTRCRRFRARWQLRGRSERTLLSTERPGHGVLWRATLSMCGFAVLAQRSRIRDPRRMSDPRLDDMIEAIKQIGAEGGCYEARVDRFHAGPVRITSYSAERPPNGRDPIPFAAYLSHPIDPDAHPLPNLHRRSYRRQVCVLRGARSARRVRYNSTNFSWFTMESDSSGGSMLGSSTSWRSHRSLKRMVNARPQDPTPPRISTSAERDYR